jgi:hypothetical protein
LQFTMFATWTGQTPALMISVMKVLSTPDPRTAATDLPSHHESHVLVSPVSR